MAVSSEAAAAALAASEASAGPRLVQHTRLKKALRRGDFLPALPADVPVVAALMVCKWDWQRNSIGQNCSASGTGSPDPTPIRPAHRVRQAGGMLQAAVMASPMCSHMQAVAASEPY